MTDWLQRYMATKEKKLEELGEFLKTFPSAQKGGPGSGHWGHAGRPGFVGGSAPGRMGGRGRVNREYFTKGPGRHMVAELTPAEREGAIAQLTQMRVQPRHIAGLKRITTEPPADSPREDWHDDWSVTNIETGEKTEGVLGTYTYATATINIRSEFLTEDVSQRVQAGESWRSYNSHILSHELGHHVTYKKSAWYQEGHQKLDEALGRLAEKAKSKKLKRKRVWSAGLRPYSLTSQSELRADIWKIYQFGGKTQRKTLAQLLGVKSLDAIFGE